MKKQLILLLALWGVISVSEAQNKQTETRYNILLTGASFASPENGWFEIACRELHANPMNRAIGGEAIANTANRMADGSLYTREELENMDAMVIMQVHDRDVFENSGIKENFQDYMIPFDRNNYAAAFDYVIKRYLSDCYELRNDSTSKYYKTRSGKPAVIVLCTNWHDGRPLYNHSVRKLAEKWGLPLVKFDEYIGFSRNSLHPVTKKQVSLIYAQDEQVMDKGDIFGWHPVRGENSYIQQRMAAVFAEEMKNILPLKFQ
ncbi:MAG: DUF5040 domain-containing protein [Dysgonamonadaceae bacterium]|jgi:hypothetical protein|nr:DUF5040 domain-containing protein [Dysgonamonadaceae bacterium]